MFPLNTKEIFHFLKYAVSDFEYIPLNCIIQNQNILNEDNLFELFVIFFNSFDVNINNSNNKKEFNIANSSNIESKKCSFCLSILCGYLSGNIIDLFDYNILSSYYKTNDDVNISKFFLNNSNSIENTSSNNYKYNKEKDSNQEDKHIVSYSKKDLINVVTYSSCFSSSIVLKFMKNKNLLSNYVIEKSLNKLNNEFSNIGNNAFLLDFLFKNKESENISFSSSYKSHSLSL